MKKQRFIQLIITVLCAVFFVCAGFAVSDYFRREDTVTAEAASVTYHWGVKNNTLYIDTVAISDANPSGTHSGTTAASWSTEISGTVRDSITKIVINRAISPENQYNWFNNFPNLTDVSTLSKVDSNGFYNMNGLFSGNKSLTDISPIANWTFGSKITQANYTFRDCTSLTDISPISGWGSRFNNITSLYNFFAGCTSLTDVSPIYGWNTSKIAIMSGFFEGCTSLETVDLSGWSFSSVLECANMFAGTNSLKTVTLSDEFVNKVSSLTSDMAGLFSSPHETWIDSNGNKYTADNPMTVGGVYRSCAHRNLTATPARTPTCTASGTAAYWTCNDCNSMFSDAAATTEITAVQTVPATGHSKGAHHDAADATCAAPGNMEYYDCANGCGSYLNDAGNVLSSVTLPVDSTKHNYGPYVSDGDATCTADGHKSATCSICHNVDRIVDVGSATGHNFDTEWTTNPAEHWHKCLNNNCSETSGKAAHSYTWVVDTPATVTSTGLKHEECVCGLTRNPNTVIPIITCQHTSTTHVSRVEATCTTAGNVEYWHCADCGNDLDGTNTPLASTVIPIDNTAHVFTNYISNNDAICTADGTKTAECDHGCGTKDTVTDIGTQLSHSYTNYVSNNDATCTADGTKTAECDHGCGTKDTVTDTGTQLSHSFTNYVSDNNATCNADGTKTAHCDHGCGATDTVTDTGSMKQHSYEWVITKPATKDEAGLMQNKCTVCGDVAEEKEIAKLEDPNGGGEIDLPVDINVEFKVTQSSTNNDYSDLEGMKQGYWAQLWYRNEDGTLGDEFTDKMNCFLTLKIPTEIIEAIRGGEEINRDKIAEGLTVYYYVDGQRYNVDNFAIAQRDDESWQIKFNYNAKFRAEVVFNAANFSENSEPAAGIPWWVWLIVGLAGAAVVGVVIVIIVVAKKKSAAAVVADNGEVLGRLDRQDEKIDRLIEISDGGFNDIVDDE